MGLGAIDVLCRVCKGVWSVWSRDSNVVWSLQLARRETRVVEEVVVSNGGAPPSPRFVTGFDPGSDLGSRTQSSVMILLRPGIDPEELRRVFLQVYSSTTARLGFTDPPQLWEPTPQPREPMFRHLDVRQDA